ncbi:MAG: hypothetical protein WC102_09225 [Saccharofermentanales bacterium]
MKKGIIYLSLISIIMSTSLFYSFGFISSDFLTGEEVKKVLTETGDSIVATINGEEITSKEVSLLKYQYANTTLDENTDISNFGLIIKIAKDKLIIQESLKIGISIGVDETNIIIERLNSSFDKNYEKNTEFIRGLGISRKELIDLMFIQESTAIVKSRYKINFAQSLNDGKITVSDESLNKSISDFIEYLSSPENQDTQNISKTTEHFQKLYNQYIDYIFNNSEFIILEEN